MNALIFEYLHLIHWIIIIIKMLASHRFCTAANLFKQSSLSKTVPSILSITQRRMYRLRQCPVLYKNINENVMTTNSRNYILLEKRLAQSQHRYIAAIKGISSQQRHKIDNPKNKLDAFYQIIMNNTNQKDIYNYNISEVRQKKQAVKYKCLLSVKWPETNQFMIISESKKRGVHSVAQQCLKWLESKGRVRNDKPVIYSKEEVRDIWNKPYSIDINSDIINDMEELNNIYDKEIHSLLLNSKNYDLYKKVDISSLNLSPIQSNTPDDSNAVARNETLKSKLRPSSNNGLPISQYRNRILQMIQENQIILIRGDTACGKSTQVPQFLMEDFSKEGNATDCNILVSQPRRISAISIAEYVAEERGESLGDVVGYHVRHNNILPKERGNIVFCTTGILLRRLQNDPEALDYSHIILDEAHERTVENDLAMTIVKKALQKNPKLKVIVMSATIETELIKSYFDCPSIDIPGLLYPVNMHFLEDIQHLVPITQYNEAINEFDIVRTDCYSIANLIRWLNKNEGPGAILCFLPGWQEISKVQSLLETNYYNDEPNILTVPLHSKMNHIQQHTIFSKPPKHQRKVILATDIAETGITVGDVVYVVDSCIKKNWVWKEKTGEAVFKSEIVARANIHQRKGRAGRVQPGKSYHFITKEQYDNLEEFPKPDVLRTTVEKLILESKRFTSEQARDFFKKMPESPSIRAVEKSVSSLKNMNVLDMQENLTDLGQRIAHFTLHPKLSKAIILSSIFKCVNPTVTLAAISGTERSMFSTEKDNKAALRNFKQQVHPNSDHLALTKIFSLWSAYPKTIEEEMQNVIKIHRPTLHLLKREYYAHMKDLQESRMCNILATDIGSNNDLNLYENDDQLILGVFLSAVNEIAIKPKVLPSISGLKVNNNILITQKKERVSIPSDSVNYKSENWISPFYTYYKTFCIEDQNRNIISETSLLHPLTVFLFDQGKMYLQTPRREDITSIESEPLIFRIDKKPLIKFSCDERAAFVLHDFRKALWSIVNYFIEVEGHKRSEQGEQEYNKVREYTRSMLSLLSKALHETDGNSEKGRANNNISYENEDAY
ncbi:ATP-dependent RNA helicase DHX30-like [Prorops nasuta]|uniref:ATP-dependent RNA helicase DHX30-like n=1 Tax=Prorops nasuta TaxID=863751 RepID=UPI0034CD0C9B